MVILIYGGRTMKTVLVVGATGFVGSHALSWLLEQPEVEVIAACRDRRKLPREFKGEVREGDLRDGPYLATLLERVDAVVNAAAWSSLFGHEEASNSLFLQPSMALAKAYFKGDAKVWVNVSTTSASAPEHSRDAMSAGIPRPFWPHLVNVIHLEDYLREEASLEHKVVNLRLGIFVGSHYSLGVLPILLPRLKTHLVPWVQGGDTELPLTDGRDLGQALGRAALYDGAEAFESINVVGSEVPSVREVLEFLHTEFAYPKPHFSVPFPVAYGFAWLMEKLDAVVPWEPLIVRSIVHLLENTGADNQRASSLLGYKPEHHWRDSIRVQIDEMSRRQRQAMSMAKPVE